LLCPAPVNLTPPPQANPVKLEIFEAPRGINFILLSYLPKSHAHEITIPAKFEYFQEKLLLNCM